MNNRENQRQKLCLEKCNTPDEPLARLVFQKSEKTQVTKTRNKKEEITSGPTNPKK